MLREKNNSGRQGLVRIAKRFRLGNAQRFDLLGSAAYTVIVLMVFGLPSLVEPVPFDPSIPVELMVLNTEETPPEPEPEEPKAEEEAPKPKPPPTKQTPLPIAQAGTGRRGRGRAGAGRRPEAGGSGAPGAARRARTASRTRTRT